MNFRSMHQDFGQPASPAFTNHRSTISLSQRERAGACRAIAKRRRVRSPLQKSRIDPLNRSDRSPFQVIGRRFSLSQRERAGARESRSNENVVQFMGRESRWNENVVRFMVRSPRRTSRIGPLNRCDRSPSQAIRRQFSLSQRERAGVRESRANENVVRFMGRESRSNENILRSFTDDEFPLRLCLFA
jgi:hypothetical protein